MEMQKLKHVPMRMCVICRCRKPKEELIRISGEGRGSYVCMNEKASGMIGLARRAGKLIWGEDTVLEAIRSGKAQLVLIAGDASDNTKKLFNDKCSYYRVKVFEYGTKADFGHASMAVVDKNFSDAIINLLGGGK